jgi:tetratricopeptide (TPR) repeat protein
MFSALRNIGPLLVLLLASSFTYAQSYQGELDQGIASYKQGHYAEAIQHFRKATDLDPSQTKAHMYLGTAYVGQYIPGVETPDNKAIGEQAAEQYQYVLNSDAPTDSKLSATKGIAYIYLNMKRFDDAKDYYEKASALDPNDPEPHYSTGVIDWTQCYQPRIEARNRLKLSPEQHLDPGNPEQKKVCDDLQARNSSLIEDGISNLNKAIQLRPDYDDAMAYLNLMYRERADLDCNDPAAREGDLQTADEWVDKTLAVKKAKAEKAFRQAVTTAPNRQ